MEMKSINQRIELINKIILSIVYENNYLLIFILINNLFI